MPVAEQSKIFNNFTGGLNTEATGLNFPENGAVEIDNFELFRTGEVKRRLGANLEGAYVLSSTQFNESSFDTFGVSVHEWKAVNGVGETNFLAIQVGLQVFFHDLGSEPISGALLGSVDLEPLRTGASAQNFAIDASFGEGRMVITNQELEPSYVEYNADDGTFSLNQISIRVRDFDGVDDGLETGDRPENLSQLHHYNLLNQGWPPEISVAPNAQGAGNPSQGDPIQSFKVVTGKYPSNADQVASGKLGAVESASSLGTFHPSAIQKLALGNTPAPKGHFIINPFNIQRDQILATEGSSTSYITGSSSLGIPSINISLPDSEIDLTTLQGVTTELRPTATEFYAGRVFFAGANGPENSGDVFFSQTITDISMAGDCFQEADPTGEDINSLVDTDGGVIHIARMGTVQKMVPLGQDLVIIAANGIWAISGPVGGNFTASNFSVRKITDLGTLNRDSVVEADGTILWWNQGGIYQMSSGQISDELEINRLSEDTIQTFYDTIPNAARAYCRAFYDDFSKKIFWFYNDDASYDGINFRYDYNRTLVYDLTLQAFYTYTLGTLAANSPVIAAMTQKNPGTSEIVTFDVILSNDDIVLSSDDIVQDVAFPSFADTKLKLLTFVRDRTDGTLINYTFGEFNSREFKDWATWDALVSGGTGADYESVIQAGWQHFGDPLPLKKITHVVSYFNRTEDGFELDSNNDIQYTNPSGGTVQTRWQWTDTDVGRWTKEETAYRLLRRYIPDDENDTFDYGETIIKTKLAMRGKGNAFGIRYKSESGTDMQLIGFGVNIRAGTKL